MIFSINPLTWSWTIDCASIINETCSWPHLCMLPSYCVSLFWTTCLTATSLSPWLALYHVLSYCLIADPACSCRRPILGHLAPLPSVTKVIDQRCKRDLSLSCSPTRYVARSRTGSKSSSVLTDVKLKQIARHTLSRTPSYVYVAFDFL